MQKSSKQMTSPRQLTSLLLIVLAISETHVFAFLSHHRVEKSSHFQDRSRILTTSNLHITSDGGGGEKVATAQAQANVVPGEEMKALASTNTPFGSTEIEKVVRSLRGLLADGTDGGIDWNALRSLIQRSAHKSHKNWPQTEKAAEELSKIVGGPDSSIFQAMFHRVLSDGNWAGGLSAAQSASKAPGSRHQQQPWVVLVTGLNGIRKTTSVYQPWFKPCLAEALGMLEEEEEEEGSDEDAKALALANVKAKVQLLPAGGDSFFRQLDYMIATLASEDFASLYGLAASGCSVDAYSAAKDSIFARYRTLAEILGVLLVKEAVKRRMNVMIETSGRDLASFRYIDHLFPDDSEQPSAVAAASPKAGRRKEGHAAAAATATTTAAAAAATAATPAATAAAGGGGAGAAASSLAPDESNMHGSSGGAHSGYNKLVAHFTVNELGFAERSVDARMAGEMAAGVEALTLLRDDSHWRQQPQVGSGNSGHDDVNSCADTAAAASAPVASATALSSARRALVGVNQGGPYGSQVLGGVQADSHRVWSEVSSDAAGNFPTWRKARISIVARDDGPWTARAQRPPNQEGTSLGKEYPFQKP